VPQNPSLPESFTVAELVMLGRTPHLKLLQSEGRRDLEVAARAMKMCGVEALADRLIGEISGGERQRVVIARALAQEPKLLLLDEPTSHLDIAHQVAVMDLIWGLSRDGLGVLAVFHDLNLAAQYSDRLVVLSGGRVIADGAPASVVTPSVIRQAYDAAVCVVPHPRNGAPVALVERNHMSVRASDSPESENALMIEAERRGG